ncbi:MAG TPA: DUF4245 family protein [Mycobacteriales bacterium]|nr:DUF4245 family protein [Mycobacteriales bacterium]
MSAGGEPARGRRGFETIADMGRSLGLVLAFTVVVLLAGAGRVLLFPGRHAGPPPVSYDTEVRVASRLAGVAMPAPARPPGGWTATSVRVTGGGPTPVHLHIGFTTPGAGYVALEEAAVTGSAGSAAFLTGELGPGAVTVRDSVLVAGTGWRELRDTRAELALTRTAAGVTILVYGSTGLTDLETMAAALG